ncbi:MULTISPECIES: alpha/beta fold hydrolase [unclassified Rhodosalinus]|uniref:alpha/beta fold hydrolase n=1 Tax=unclassified Rhodosalinus TaxID=2630183 RepID=UPI003524AF52
MADWTRGPATLEAGGKRLEYACWGPPPGEAPTIAMLHEGLGCLALWRDVPEALAARTGWGVMAWSRAGYGQSDPADLPRPLDYMTREAQDVLPQVLDAIGFREGVLLGHSDGATIAAEYAGGVEDFRVRGLVLMAPHFFTEEPGLREIARAREAFETGDLRARMAKYHRDPDAAFRGWNDAWLDPGFRAWNVAECIDYLRIPALAIQGREDPYGTLAQIRELEERAYSPVDTVILDECRHAPHLERPEATLDAVAEFCARLARIEAAEVETA